MSELWGIVHNVGKVYKSDVIFVIVINESAAWIDIVSKKIDFGREVSPNDLHSGSIWSTRQCQ